MTKGVTSSVDSKLKSKISAVRICGSCVLRVDLFDAITYEIDRRGIRTETIDEALENPGQRRKMASWCYPSAANYISTNTVDKPVGKLFSYPVVRAVQSIHEPDCLNIPQ